MELMVILACGTSHTKIGKYPFYQKIRNKIASLDLSGAALPAKLQIVFDRGRLLKVHIDM